MATSCSCQYHGFPGKTKAEAEAEADAVVTEAADNEAVSVPELTTIERLKVIEMHITKAWREECGVYLSARQAVISVAFARTCMEAIEASSAGIDVNVSRPSWPTHVIKDSTQRMAGWQGQKALDLHGITSHYIRISCGGVFTLSLCV